MLFKRRSIFLVLFFVSGACGLIYEIVWTRLFTPVIGNTVFSLSAILTVFMTGLGVGSRLAGRKLDSRPMRLIRTYALLEAGVGAYNLVLPLLLKLADPVFGVLYRSAHDSVVIFAFARLVIAFCLLIFPTSLMGATLPVLIRFYVGDIAAVGSETGRVYTSNTLGAAIGVFFAGFVLIPQSGVGAALMIAAVLNLLIAGLAWFLSQEHDSASRAQMETTTATGPRLVLAAMLTSGFAALMNEVAWTRVLGLAVGPTTYAFTLMLVSMIAGIGIGAAFAAYWAGRQNTTLSTLAWIEIGVGAATMAMIPAFGRLPLWIGKLVTRHAQSFTTIQVSEFAIFFLLMLVPATLLGMTFPIASRLYTKSDSLVGTEVSAVYAFNTAGGILGSLIAGFFLIPHIGLQTTLILASCISLGTGILLARLRVQFVFAAALLLLYFIFNPRWDPELMASGAYKYAPYYAANLDLETALKSGKLVYFKEGAPATVSIRQYRGDTMLSVDGKVDASDTGDMTTQKMLAHLPLLLARNTRHVGVIGLGSGVTAGAALQHPIESLDVIEISPEVVAASRYFEHVNHHPLEDRRTTLIVGDGRNHLRYSDKKYDVTISEPSNPWMSGMASLFTRDFFSEVLARLTPNGIHCQWLHSYNMSTEDLRTIIGTFRSVFPHAQLWAPNENDLLLLGSPSKIDIEEQTLSANFRDVAGDLEAVRMKDLYSLLSLYLLEDDDLDAFAAGAPFNTDDRPVLEFDAPRYLYADTSDKNFAALNGITHRIPTPPLIAKVVAEATAENYRHKGEMYAASESYKLAVSEFQKAIMNNIEDEAAWHDLVEFARGPVDRKKLEGLFDETLASQPPPIARLAAADFFMAQMNYAKAAAVLEAMVKDDPKNIAALEKLVDVYGYEGNGQLPAIVDRLRAIDPENPKALYHFATLLFYQGRVDEAIRVGERIIQREPKNIRARNFLAYAYVQTFQPEKADAEFRRAMKFAPGDIGILNNYGLFLMQRGRYQEALERFREAIEINPENVQGYVGIGEAYRQSGNMPKAIDWYRRALRLDPNQPTAKQFVY
jgi:spermidine synthase